MKHPILRLFLPLLMLAAGGCDEHVTADELDEPSAAADAGVDDELAAAPCLTDSVEPGALPTPPRGMLEPRFRIDESEDLSPEALVPPPPTDDELRAALEYSDRHANGEVKLRDRDSG
ncbi:MAG: hypothetical protein ACE37F_24010 [Nannocystaceae bacterium]|nr:hypothetical protein [bacterium]